VDAVVLLLIGRRHPPGGRADEDRWHGGGRGFVGGVACGTTVHGSATAAKVLPEEARVSRHGEIDGAVKRALIEVGQDECRPAEMAVGQAVSVIRIAPA